MITTKSIHAFRATVFAILVAAVTIPVSASASQFWARPVGSWYLALDAEPYTGIPGISLPGMITLHSDQSMLLVDAGDFGGLPFSTRDTAQLGTWRFDRRGVRGVALFLQADSATGDVRSWFRVSLSLQFKDADTLAGTVNVAKLDCVGPAPFPVFNCPDPIAGADAFIPEGPPNVPITLRRLRVPTR